MTPDTAPAGRQLWAGLDLLDHQIVDSAGMLAGKVDDLELEIPDGPGALPVVTALLSGLGALAGQIGGAAGAWLGAVEARIARPEEGAESAGGRIPFGLVDEIDDHVKVSVAREALDSNRGEAWTRDVIIDKIPEQAMKLTELIGCEVVTKTGRHVGTVHDALLVQDGPMASEMHASFRLHALALGRRSLGTRLGFAHGHVTSPAVLRLLFGETLQLLPWGAILERHDGRLVIDDDLRLEEVASASQ